MDQLSTKSSREVLYDVFFALQVELEKSEEGMDYRAYARSLWEKLGHSTDEISFASFETELIKNMKSIPIDDLLNEELKDETIVKTLLELPGTKALWTKGDLSHTGYQRAKFLKSGIGLSIEATLGSNQDGGVKRFTQRKNNELGSAHFGATELDWIVGENKNTPLQAYLKQHPEITRIITVEDSLKNLQTVESICNKSGLTHYPIWVNTSREGHTLQQEDPEKFLQMSEQYNGRDSLSKIPEMNHNADSHTLWLWDFDGVINFNNIEMRQRQMNAKIKAITNHTEFDSQSDIADYLAD